MTIEHRANPDTLELRAATGDGLGTVIGIAPIYGTRSAMMFNGGRAFAEVIEPGAAKRSVNGGGRMIGDWEHRHPLADTTSGKLRLRSEADGIHYELDLPDTPAAREVRGLIDAGVVRGSSFGMTRRSVKDRWVVEDGVAVRYISELRLMTVGPVVHPAYESSPADMRHTLTGLVTETRSLDTILDAARCGDLADIIAERSKNADGDATPQPGPGRRRRDLELAELG